MSRLAQHAFGRLLSRFMAALRSRSRVGIHVQAVLAGAVLGAVVSGLAASADRAGEPTFRFAMALVVLAAGSSSFVLYVLHMDAAQRRGHAAARRVQARVCIALLGGGVIAAIHALQQLPA